MKKRGFILLVGVFIFLAQLMSAFSAAPIFDFEVNALDSEMDIIGSDSFNTLNLTDIEFVKINFTIEDSDGLDQGGDIRFFYTANGSNACALGNLQSSTCFSAGSWIEFKNGTQTSTFNDGGAQGDYIDCDFGGNSTFRNYTCIIDEHYNPNVFKWYDSEFNFSDLKWQSGSTQRITRNTIIKIEVNESDIPLDSDQYKLDFRVQANNNPDQPLLAFACNSSYTTGNPVVTDSCDFIAQKNPSQLQDDGTKFRGIFTKQLVDDLGDLKYIVLKTDLSRSNRYYSIKTYKALAAGWSTKWDYSTNDGVSYANLNDSYESELNINWFSAGVSPTQFLFLVESTDNTSNATNSSVQVVQWSIDAAQNYPPLITIISPQDATNVTDVIDINWSIALPNEDNVTTNITLHNGSVLAFDLAGDVMTYSWNTTSFADGNYNLTVETCENETVEKLCGNDTHAVTIQRDSDGDGVVDSDDTLIGDDSDVTTSGVTSLNVTIGGSSANGSFSGANDVVFYDGSTIIMNFSHNFSSSNFNMSAVSINVTTNGIVVDLNGQMQGNKTLYITDNSFDNLCVEDGPITTISDISSGCNGDNETNFDACIGSTVTINGSTCTDLGSTIEITNLQYSGIVGSQDAPTSSGGGGSSSSSDYSLGVISVPFQHVLIRNREYKGFVKGAWHTFEILSVDLANNQATFVVQSEAYQFTLTKGVSKNIDLDQDGILDLEFSLDEILSTSTVKVTLNEFVEQLAVSQEVIDEPVDEVVEELVDEEVEETDEVIAEPVDEAVVEVVSSVKKDSYLSKISVTNIIAFFGLLFVIFMFYRWKK